MVVITLCAAVEVGASADRDRDPLLAIRVVDLVGLASPELRDALAATVAVFATVGIPVDWDVCAGGAGSPGPACSGDRRRVLWVRVVPDVTRSVGTRSTLVLGAAAVDPVTRRGVHATVYPTRVRRFSERAGLDFAWVLGRVVAHELGHLILGSTRHQGPGLMRARWSAHEGSRDPGRWRFSAQEGAQLRGRLAAEAHPPAQDTQHHAEHAVGSVVIAAQHGRRSDADGEHAQGET